MRGLVALQARQCACLGLRMCLCMFLLAAAARGDRLWVFPCPESAAGAAARLVSGFLWRVCSRCRSTAHIVPRRCVF